MDRNPRLTGGMCRPTNHQLDSRLNTARAGEIAARRSSESHLDAVKLGFKKGGTAYLRVHVIFCSAEMASPKKTIIAVTSLLFNQVSRLRRVSKLLQTSWMALIICSADAEVGQRVHVSMLKGL